MTAQNLPKQYEHLAYEVAQAIDRKDSLKLEKYIYSAIKCQILGFDVSFYADGLTYAEKHFPKGWEWFLDWNKRRVR